MNCLGLASWLLRTEGYIILRVPVAQSAADDGNVDGPVGGV
jgi:hypothetical protein